MFTGWGAYQAKLGHDYQLDIVEINRISAENDNKIVYTTGKLEVDKPAKESDYDVTPSEEPIVLKRTVEMYQYYISGDSVVKEF